MTKDIKLNLGCGCFKKDGFINVDQDPRLKPDKVLDLNKLPYKFKANSVDYIEMNHVLEHLTVDIFKVMNELHRILKPGGLLRITVPHFSRGFSHAQHLRSFDVSFPLYFKKGHILYNYAQDNSFELLKLKLHWSAQSYLKKKIFPFFVYYPLIWMGVFIDFFANLSPAFCSRIWCYWVGGFEEVELVFKKS